MSLQEVGFRSRRVVAGLGRRRRAARGPRQADQYDGAVCIDAGDYFRALTEPSSPTFYFEPSTRHAEWFSSRWTKESEEIVRLADGAMNGKIPVWDRFGEPQGGLVDWHQDPFSNKKWPRRFSDDIPLSERDDVGDVRSVWELNRLHWLVLLAQANYLTGDTRYREALHRHLDSWILANPVDIGINWISTMETAIRVQSWIWMAHLLAPRAVTNRSLSRILLQLALHGTHHVRANLAAHSSANNHLIVEAATLFIAGVLLPWSAESEDWLHEGKRILAREVERQVFPDGVCREQAVHYHEFVLEALLLVLVIADSNGIELPNLIRDVALRMAVFLDSFSDGDLPCIGDSDDGRVVRLGWGPRAAETRDSMIGLAAGLYPGTFTASQEQSPAEVDWILGVQESDRLPNACRFYSRYEEYAHGGYVIMRGGGKSRLVLNAGPFGLGPLHAHAHADALAICLSIGREPVLVDSGTYCYNIERPLRDYFRSTTAHNTVTVDGRSQADATGAFLWRRFPAAAVKSRHKGRDIDVVVGEHDGYAPITHKRIVVNLGNDLFLVADLLDAGPLDGRGSAHEYVQRFHLAPHLHANVRPEGASLINEGSTTCSMTWLDRSVSTSVVETQGSSHFLERHPARVIERSHCGHEGRFALLISTNQQQQPAVCLQPAAVTVTVGPVTHLLMLGQSATDTIAFEGDFLLVSEYLQKGANSLVAYGARQLRIRDNTLVSDGEPDAMIRIDW
jgi:uncharacterized heparinase superfamily protein